MTALVRLVVLAGASAYVVAFWLLAARWGILDALAILILALVVYGFLQHQEVGS